MAPATAEKECIYQTKVIRFLGHLTPIILQNENGPSPLLAICNVLLLRGNIKLNQDTSQVSQDILLSLVRSCMINTVSDKDAIDVLSRLKVTTWTGINLQFSSITDFEFTQDRAIFHLLNIPLYHGCVVDPQDNDTASAIGQMSYNCLTRKLLAFVAENFDKILLADKADYFDGESTKLTANFLSNNASQLTFHGFSCLQKELKESEICVFFRKSHFSTMFKYGGELYLLATDQDRGYINKAESDLVWEKLKVNGDKVLMTGNFKELCKHKLRIEKFEALRKKLLQYEEQQEELSYESDDDEPLFFLSPCTRGNLR